MATTNLTKTSSTMFTMTIGQRQSLLQYAKSALYSCTELGAFRNLLLYRDKAYQRTLDITKEHLRAVVSNRMGDTKRIQNMTVPIVMPAVESATAYQAGVFLSSAPIFGVVSTAAQIDQANQFETVLQDQSVKFGWQREFIKSLRNGFKFNFGPTLIRWEKLPLSKIVTDTSISAAGLARLSEYSYQGNQVKSLDPYNVFMDMRVNPSDMHTDGEFFGYHEIKSRINLKRLMQRLDSTRTAQFKEAFESQFAGTNGSGSYQDGYYVPEVNPFLNNSALSRGVTNWNVWAGLEQSKKGGNDINYKDNYLVTHFYCRAVPSDFGRAGNKPSIFYCIIVNWQFVIYVEEITAAHDFLPILICQPNDDNLGYQVQSMLDTALPFQDMSSALWNISLESKRRQVFDRLLYNPGMVSKEDISPASSVQRIPVRNIGMSDANPFQRALFQIPFRDENSASNLQMADLVSSMSDKAVGQNQVEQGQFVKGNKTNDQFNQTMTSSAARSQLVSLSLECSFFTPAKEIIRSNTLQNQGQTSILNRESKELVQVDPVALRQAVLEFKLTDGLLPMDKLLSPELMQVFIQTATAMPVLASEYDIMGMFVYWCKLKGAKWLDEFKRNPEQQQQFIQQLGATSAAQNELPPSAQKQPPAPVTQ